MKHRYVIGFLISMVLLLSILDIGYYMSYQISRKNTISNSSTEEEPNLPADGQATKNEGYYLVAQNGYIIVYLSDKETFFQYTNIQLQDLPDAVQEEIKSGKAIKTSKELYAFLENYSS